MRILKKFTVSSAADPIQLSRRIPPGMRLLFVLFRPKLDSIAKKD